MRIGKVPTEGLALTNCVFISPGDFGPKTRYILVNSSFVFAVKAHESIESGVLAMSRFQRLWTKMSLNEEVRVENYDPLSDANCFISRLSLQVSFVNKATAPVRDYNSSDMAMMFLKSYSTLVFSKGQLLCFDFQDHRVQRGVLTEKSVLTFLPAPNSFVKITGKHATTAPLIRPDFIFEDLGIGGLQKEFADIFRRAFTSRLIPIAVVERLGIQHVKGVVLFGPPGTGKTLLARQLGKMLNAREPVVVNGPEILNKYVGESEENIRKLFEPAEKEYKQRGDASSLHIIIFDEIDAICRQRGSRADSTGVGDSVVNQLLAKLDGVEPLNNILVIGMTNRIDMLDDALLRPGRLEIKVEISLPDHNGRLEIFKIHTAK
ncbi:transport between ER and Golgi ATPase protein, partial [Cladochytrium tenue]